MTVHNADLYTTAMCNAIQNWVILRNGCLFFWAHGEWIVARDKQIAVNPEKKLIPYIYNASNKVSF